MVAELYNGDMSDEDCDTTATGLQVYSVQLYFVFKKLRSIDMAVRLVEVGKRYSSTISHRCGLYVCMLLHVCMAYIQFLFVSITMII